MIVINYSDQHIIAAGLVITNTEGKQEGYGIETYGHFTIADKVGFFDWYTKWREHAKTLNADFACAEVILEFMEGKEVTIEGSVYKIRKHPWIAKK